MKIQKQNATMVMILVVYLVFSSGKVLAVTEYETPIILPDCNPSNPEVKIIDSDSDWGSINDADKRIFCVHPGDYTGRGEISIAASGTSSNPRWIRWYDPANPNDDTTHPVKMSQSERAIIREIEINGDYWIVDRVYVDGEYMKSGLVVLRDGINNIFNRGVVEESNGDIFFLGPNTVQNSVIRRSLVEVGKDNTCLGGIRPGSKVVNNEIYDCAGDAIIFAPGQLHRGTVIYNNDIYIETEGFAHENGIDFKSGGVPGDWIIVEKNRFWNIGGEGGTGGSPGAVDFSNAEGDKEYILFKDNIFWDCALAFTTATGSEGGSSNHLSLIGNVFYNVETAIKPVTQTQYRHEFYYNTIIDVKPGGYWFDADVRDSDVRCNLVINGQGHDFNNMGGTQIEYNAFYNTAQLNTEGGGDDIIFSGASDSQNKDYCFTIKQHTDPTIFCIPYVQTTDQSPHRNLCTGANPGTRHDIGINDTVFTQEAAGATTPDGTTGARSIHIDSSAGNGGDGSQGSPYNEFSDISWSQVQSWIDDGHDVEIRLRRGGTWNENIAIGASGTPSHWIKLTSYGTGNKPSIDRSDSSSTRIIETLDHDHVWFDDLEIAGGRYQIYIGNYQGFDGGTIRVTRCTLHDAYKISIYANGGDITIGGNQGDGNNFYNNGDGTTSNLGDMQLTDRARFTVSWNTMHGNGNDDGYDAVMSDAGGTQAAQSIIENNHIYNKWTPGSYEDGHGVNLKDAYNVIVRFNHIHDNKRTGISVQNDCEDIEIYGNRVHGHGRSGLTIKDSDDECGPGTKRIKVWANMIYENSKYGIDSGKEQGCDILDGVDIFNNVIALNGRDMGASRYTGLYYSFSGGYYNVKNNIFYKNNPEATDYRQLYMGSASGVSLEDNLFYWPGHSSMVYWESGDVIAVSAGSGNIEEDPLFTDLNIHDYTLSGTSPAINTGADLGSPFSMALNPLSVWVNSVSTLDQNSYGSGWERGAYVYVGEPHDCEYLNGDCCSGLQSCEDGSFVSSSDCGSLCCLGTCWDGPEGDYIRFIEAESGALSTPMQTGSDSDASGGQYIYVPAGTGDSTSPTGEAVYTINIPGDGDYFIWLLMYGPTSQNDALYIGFNGNFDRVYPSAPGQYEWVKAEAIHGSGNYNHSLLLGQNEVQISHGEELARADRIFLTNDQDLHPSQVSFHPADTSPRDGCIEEHELIPFIDLWKYDSTANPMWEMMEAVSLYYNPGVWCP